MGLGFSSQRSDGTCFKGVASTPLINPRPLARRWQVTPAPSLPRWARGAGTRSVGHVTGSRRHRWVHAMQPPGTEVCRGPTRPGRAGALAASSTGPAEALGLQTVPEDLTQAREAERKWAAGGKNGVEKRTLPVN